jgi:beta-lactamase class A
MPTDIEQLFADASCAGWLCVQTDDTDDEVTVSADEPVVAASVFKVLVALAAESAFADGRLDPVGPIRLPATHRTPGPVGFSLFEDDVIVSGRDLVSAMLTISDNVATDALLDLVGVDACNRLAGDVGLGATEIVGDLDGTIESIARVAGFPSWMALGDWLAVGPPADERERVDRRVRQSAALDPARAATRTTARDMCLLLRLIWADRAGPPEACLRVRRHMARQLTRHRLAAAFPPPARVAAKSGSLVGIIRNEVGVIDRPDGQRFYAAVFTRGEPSATEARVNAVIGAAAAAAVDRLRR